MLTAQLALLDGFTLTNDGDRMELPKTLQRLVAYLGLRRQATRADTVGALWPEVSEDKALGSLRTALWRLHQLGTPVVETNGETLSLAKRVLVDVDHLVRSVRAVLTADERPPTTEVLVTGVRELLPGWFDDWVLIERERLRQLCLHALEKLSSDSLAQDRHTDALEAALAALRAEPLRETPYRLLIEIHIAEGNYSEALATYRQYRELLAHELGVVPSPAIRSLVNEVLVH